MRGPLGLRALDGARAPSPEGTHHKTEEHTHWPAATQIGSRKTMVSHVALPGAEHPLSDVHSASKLNCQQHKQRQFTASLHTTWRRNMKDDLGSD